MPPPEDAPLQGAPVEEAEAEAEAEEEEEEEEEGVRRNINGAVGANGVLVLTTPAELLIVPGVGPDLANEIVYQRNTGGQVRVICALLEHASRA